jgi:hypothetical protein
MDRNKPPQQCARGRNHRYNSPTAKKAPTLHQSRHVEDQQTIAPRRCLQEGHDATALPPPGPEDQGFHLEHRQGEVTWSHNIAHKRGNGARRRRRHQSRHRRPEFSLGYNLNLPRIEEASSSPTARGRDTMTAKAPPDLDMGEEQRPCGTSPGTPIAAILAAHTAKEHSQHHRLVACRKAACAPSVQSCRSGVQAKPTSLASQRRQVADMQPAAPAATPAQLHPHPGSHHGRTTSRRRRGNLL